ncbi:Uncharacterized protein PRO82_000706 [Candidatus Protochlamydia amoebophila]|nr:Uncharacterized protein [Candidatus Protochlamydia amoebophila]
MTLLFWFMGRLIVLIQLASLARTKRAIADITKANSSSSQIDLYLAYYESYFFLWLRKNSQTCGFEQ